MDTDGAGLRRDARRGAGARVRRGRPDRRRRGLRRRGQGRDPGQPRLPHPGHRRRRLPRGHHRRLRLRHRLGPRDRLRRQARRALPALRGAAGRLRAQRLGARAPGDDPAHATRWPAVGGAYNAVFVESRSAGRLMFYGPGAGGSPTASAVLGDLVTVARNRVRGAVGPGESSYAARRVSPIGDVTTRYHLSLEVADVAGVLASIAQVFAEHERVHPDRPAERSRRRRAAGRRDPPRPRRAR